MPDRAPPGTREGERWYPQGFAFQLRQALGRSGSGPVVLDRVMVDSIAECLDALAASAPAPGAREREDAVRELIERAKTVEFAFYPLSAPPRWTVDIAGSEYGSGPTLDVAANDALAAFNLEFPDAALRQIRAALEGMRLPGAVPPHITDDYVAGTNWTITRALAIVDRALKGEEG